jgi:hypothetical protein
MLHVKHFGTIWAKNLTRPKTAALLQLVRSIDFLVQFLKSGGGAPMARLVAGTGPRCKIHANDRAKAEADAWPYPSPAFDTGMASNNGMEWNGMEWYCTRILHREGA